jgi:hypothetical protein
VRGRSPPLLYIIERNALRAAECDWLKNTKKALA